VITNARYVRVPFFGTHGCWEARYDKTGELIPVVHLAHMNWRTRRYRDRNWHRVPEHRSNEFVGRMREIGMVIFQLAERDYHGTLHRTGYVGNTPLYVSEIECNGRVLSFLVGEAVDPVYKKVWG
jgi:hypothetical protein